MQKHINKEMKNDDNRLLDKFFVLFFQVCKLKVKGNKVLKSRKLHTLTTYLGPLPTPMLFSAVVGHPPTVRAVPGLSTCALMASPLKFVTPEWSAAPLQANSDRRIGLQITKTARQKAIVLWKLTCSLNCGFCVCAGQ